MKTQINTIRVLLDRLENEVDKGLIDTSLAIGIEKVLESTRTSLKADLIKVIDKSIKYSNNFAWTNKLKELVVWIGF